MSLRMLLAGCSVLEAATGLALIVAPGWVATLLFGNFQRGESIAIARVAGFALLSLGLACWPDHASTWRPLPSLRAMLIYNLSIAIYLTVLGLRGASVGVGLWPAVVIHGVISLLLLRGWLVESSFRFPGTASVRPRREEA